MRNLDKIFKIIAFLALLLLSVTSKAQIPLYQLEYAPDSNYVIGANLVGEPTWVLKSIDSIYLSGDSLILLKNGSGEVYKSRIYNQNGPVFDPIYTDIPNPQKGDIWVADPTYEEYNMYYDGSEWRRFNYLKPGDAGNISALSGVYANSARIISFNGISYSTVHLKGDTLVKISKTDLLNPIIDIKIDTSVLFDLVDSEPQYLNPYIVTGDTVGFYLTVAVDTVLFQNTIDTASYCCPPSFSGDTLYIGDNYVEIPKENIIGGWGITATESPAYTWNLIADSSQVATQYDLSLVSGSQTLSIDSTNRVFTIGISGGNTVKFKDTGGVDSTTVVNSYGTTITESPANQWNVTVDSSKFATVYDLSQVSGGGLPDYALLDHGSASGNTQTLTLGTWNTITFSGAQESDSGVINADASTEEIDFVVAGTYRIEYFATWIANVSTYVLAGIYSDNGAAQLTKSQVQVRSQTGFLSTTVSKVFYHTAIAGETIKLQIKPDSANHTSVGIYSYLIATKVN